MWAPQSAAPVSFEETVMLGWAIAFALLAIVAGFLGFFSLAGLAATIAKLLFIVFLALLVVSFLVRALRGQSVL
jgi:uncharacterized membrane protein YtjA (UPF0391 family)